MPNICENLQIIGDQIRNAEAKYGRKPDSVKLLAVSKYHPISALETANACGQQCFGENYVQEMQSKVDALQNRGLDWHFIGPIQSNKTKHIASMANWVHSVDRLKIAKRLSEQKPEGKAPLSICLQVNISNEVSKSGVMETELLPLAENIQTLAGVKLRGLMAIPAPESNFDKQRAMFARVRQLQENLNQQGFELDTLSMGMTGDMEAAIAEGATIVRIGTAIFGSRES